MGQNISNMKVRQYFTASCDKLKSLLQDNEKVWSNRLNANFIASFFRKENVVRARNEGGRKKPEAVQLFNLLYYSRN